MAEKEERILVLTTHNEDGECECVTQDGCHANDSCAICNVGITRSEAIDRIAKTLCEEERKYCVCGNNIDACEKERIYCAYWADAEAALNALLEDK